LISMDALRPDHLGCYGYKRDTSPNIDKLVKEGIIFTQAISQSSHTAPSNTSLITSTYPNVHNVKDWGYQLNSKAPLYTLPEILKKHGYTTALISDQISFSLIKAMKRVFVTYTTLLSTTYGPTGKLINEITDWAIDWLSSNKDKKFFLWLYYLNPHAPYRPPKPYDKIFLNDEYYNIKKSVPLSDDPWDQTPIGKIPRFLAENNITDVDYYISQYDGEIRYTDSQIGRLYEALKKLRLDKKTIIIITSDHGEAMGEHNLYFRHCTFLYDELIKVPLMIRFNKTIPSGKKIDTQVRSIDIMPTILDILNINPKNFNALQGRSLLPLIASERCAFPPFAYSEFLNRKSVRGNGWKLIYDKNNQEFELYSLKEDPQETNNLIDKERDQFEYLKKKLDEYIQQADSGSGIEKQNIDESDKEKLRSLGYSQ